ncbi:Fic/DOC family protein [Vibrio alginolyticus]|uniref:Fic/DOC family protein n=1 Tax=Vibrio alginolyticus TaxID=663 RepID=UPI00215FA6D2|nr:Fic family protein [Vibrio alginolyticus]MCS0126580.1 Fic family protein [Vibrio alginolyticus]
MDKYGCDQDPLCYPDTDILINKLGIKDNAELQEAEQEFARTALCEIEFEDPPYDLAYLQSLHKTLFGRVYDWAGEIRDSKISKGETVFCVPNRIVPEANKYFNRLADKNFFQGMDEDEFVIAMADLYADINSVHPFREGNGRAQRILFEHLALYNDYQITWKFLSTEEWIKANIDGFKGDSRALVDIFKLQITKIGDV